MRVHVRTVPGRIEGDVVGKITARNWAEAKHSFTERILDLVEEKAPDLRANIIGKFLETPEDIESENPNFVGGDCVSGAIILGRIFSARPLLGGPTTQPLSKIFI